MRDRARQPGLLALGVVLLCAMPGCNAVREWFSPAEEAALGQPVGPVERVQDATLTDPDTRQGLGVRLMVVDDTNYDAARALREVGALGSGVDPAASPIDPRVREAWSRWGFRLIPVPMERLDATLGRLTPVRPLSVQWLGEFGSWRPIVRTGNNNQPRVRVGESSLVIEPGRPMLIARSWSTPRLGEEGVDRVLRVDLGIQIEQRRSGEFALLPDQRERTLDDQGQVIDELLSSIDLDGSHALVIVGEAPGADWSELPEPSPLASPSNQGDERIGPSAEQDGAAGDEASPESASAESVPFSTRSSAATEPSAPPLRSLGELMLVAPGSRLVRQGESRNIPKRVVIVLVPEVRGSFRMLGFREGTP